MLSVIVYIADSYYQLYFLSMEKRVKEIKNNERICTEPMHNCLVSLEKRDRDCCEICAWA